ncbi:MAG TPA: hypothetical protein VEK08_14890 [Planctomycetota bacterium]|nr:hypothetical protein [Planctomycetota bacterium]
MRVASVLLSLLCLSAVAEEVDLLDERGLRRARILCDEGDLRAGLSLLFKLTRQGNTDTIRSEARESLETMGFTPQEIFKLEPSAMSPGDWKPLADRIGALATQKKMISANVLYAQSIIKAVVRVEFGADGDVAVNVQSKELAMALDILLNVALASGAPEYTREAQRLLEKVGIAGPRAEAIRTSLEAGTVPADIQTEVVALTLIKRLQEYRSYVDERNANPDEAVRQQIFRKHGIAIYKYLKKQNPQPKQLQVSSPVLDFWRDLSAPARADEKF